MHRKRLHHIWVGIRQRCNNTRHRDYHLYGARGIKVDPLWEDQETFIDWALNNGYKSNLSIEREDVNGDYTPSNCIWADNFTQACNKRKRKNTKDRYIGVHQLPTGRWRSLITMHGKQIPLGCYRTEEEAKNARNEYIITNDLPHKLN